jgi:hypothetical protein
MRENLYAGGYGKEKTASSLPSHVVYRDALKELYTSILKFLASTVCYCSRNGLLKIGTDIVKWDKWDSLLEDVTKLEADFQEVYKILNDEIGQDESEALDARHKERMAAMNTMSNDMSGLRKAIEDEQQNQRRKELLDWLSSIDPSMHFNRARKKHESSTGSWLLVKNEDFER